MRDPRFDRLAEILTGYSTELKRNEKVLIEVFDAPDEIAIALVRAARKRGAIPFVQSQRARISRELALHATEPQLNLLARHELARMKQMDAYIAVRGSHNITEQADVPTDQMKLIAKKMRPIQDHRVQKTKWVVLRWPTPAMAQLASMSTEAFEDFFFEVCTLDYRKLQPGTNALKKLMERTDRVEIAGPGTDLRFSIKKIPAVICGGDRNIPDGEVFTAPVRDSVNGFVTFNAPTIYQGTSFDHIRLEFENGKIVKATSNQTKKLNDVLDATPAPVTSASSRSALIRTSYIQCAIFCSTKRLRGRFILLPARLMRRPIMGTAARCIGTWSTFSAGNMAAAKSILMANSFARMANSLFHSCNR